MKSQGYTDGGFVQSLASFAAKLRQLRARTDRINTLSTNQQLSRSPSPPTVIIERQLTP